MGGIPELKKKPFYAKNWFVETLALPAAVLTAVPTVVLAISTLFFPDPKVTLGTQILAWTGLVGVLFLITIGVVKVAQAIEKDRNEADEMRLDGLNAALHMIHSVVRHKCNFSRNERQKLRVTFLRVVKPPNSWTSPQELEQLINYVGGSGDGAGRRFSIRSGITGRAARENAIFAASRTNDDYNAYIDEMVKVWNYTEGDARKISYRNSWMAVPILYKGYEVTGVIYLDSNEKDFFNNGVQEQVIWACGGLGTFIDERY